MTSSQIFFRANMEKYCYNVITKDADNNASQALKTLAAFIGSVFIKGKANPLGVLYKAKGTYSK